MIKLNRKDWQEAKEQAEQILKQAEIMRIVNQNLFDVAEKELKKYPAEEKKQIPLGV